MRIPRHPVYGALYRLGYQRGQRLPKRWLKRYLPKDAVILEAGAHEGTDTLQFSYLWPNGHIHAFEPNPATREVLRGRVARRSNVSVHSVALGADETAVDLWLATAGNTGASSLLRPTGHLDMDAAIEFESRLTVPVTTIQAWATENAIDRIDGMWLDMQGLELAALQAAGPIFDTTRAIIMEVSYVELFEHGPVWPDVHAWLAGHGFEVVAQRDANDYFGDVLVAR